MNVRKEFKKICTDSKLIGAQMIVINEKKILENLSFGFRNIETKEKVNINTKFRIASISKIIVAMCVMQLVEKNLVSIDEDISKVLGFKIRNPKFPNEKITIKHLMTQTSSITDGFDDEDPKNDNLKRGYNGVNGTNVNATLRDLLVKNDGPYWIDGTYSNYRPGEKFIYSNFGCGLLACIIEKTTHTFFCDYVIENIFSKLNIDASFRIQDIEDQKNFATLYYLSEDGNKIVPSLNVKKLYDKTYNKFPLGENFRGPAGGLIINIKDLSKIMQLFLNDGIYKGIRVLDKETIDFMQQFHWINTEVSEYKAKGLQIRIFSISNQEILRGHTGDSHGLVSFFFYNPEQKLGVCFFTNGGNFKRLPFGTVDIFEKLLEKVINKYWNYQIEKNFIIDKTGLESKINNRLIKMEKSLFYKDGKAYISLFTILDGLDIMPVVTKNLVILSKNNKKISFRFMELVKTDDTYYIPLKDLLMKLDIDFLEDEETILIKYIS